MGEVDRIYAAREAAAAARARERYLAECEKMPGLGEFVRVIDRDGCRHLETTCELGAGMILAAFNPVGVLVWDSPHREPVKGKRLLTAADPKHASVNVYGPAAQLADPEIELLLRTLRFPVVGFEPVAQCVADAPLDGPAYPPPLAASYVSGVLDENPYHGLDIPPAAPYSEALVRTVAQITAAYLVRTQAEANVGLAFAKGKPTVLVATRRLGAGEKLRTGRTPLALLGGRVDLVKEVANVLAAGGAGLDPAVSADLPGMLGLVGPV